MLSRISHTLDQWWIPLIGLFALCSFAGCASHPYAKAQKKTAPIVETQEQKQVVKTALAQLRKPYLYGGHSTRGFDCSGLVYYVYRTSGISIPRTAREQQRLARPVPLRELSPGDLLFFRQRGTKPSHVGLYVGEGRFVHASTSEQAVTLSDLSNPYWMGHLVGAGRYSN